MVQSLEGGGSSVKGCLAVVVVVGAGGARGGVIKLGLAGGKPVWVRDVFMSNKGCGRMQFICCYVIVTLASCPDMAFEHGLRSLWQ